MVKIKRDETIRRELRDLDLVIRMLLDRGLNPKAARNLLLLIGLLS
jgi:hypothetical protein